MSELWTSLLAWASPTPSFPPIPAYGAQQSLTCVRSTNLRNSRKDAGGGQREIKTIFCPQESLGTDTDKESRNIVSKIEKISELGLYNVYALFMDKIFQPNF